MHCRSQGSGCAGRVPALHRDTRSQPDAVFIIIGAELAAMKVRQHAMLLPARFDLPRGGDELNLNPHARIDEVGVEAGAYGCAAHRQPLAP